jgi:hypothetical protein
MSDPPDRPAYMPILALPYWAVIGPFVEDAVRDSAKVCGRSERDLFAAATPMVLWCWRARGTPLDRRRVFSPSMVEQFIHLGMPGAASGSRATFRSALWRMTEVLNPGGAGRKHTPIPRSAPTSPYTSAEIAELNSWAQTQGTASRRRSASALLCLGLGAGLATRELLDVRTSDISVETPSTAEPQATIVVWRDRPRVVPVRAQWVQPLQVVLANLGPEDWVFRPGRQSTSQGQVSDFLTRSRTTLDVRPVRMRATWLVQHLRDGTPAEQLLQISGLKHYAALDNTVRLIQNADDLKEF